MYSSFSATQGLINTQIYPEREEPRPGWFDRLGTTLAGMIAPLARPKAARFDWVVERVNEFSDATGAVADDQILPMARNLGQRMRREGFTEELVGRTFALVREVAGRELGMRHFDVQLIGGLVLLKGMVAEMETGEGKTLTATLAACAMALTGTPVHIVTVNDYLAGRDAETMGPIYQAFGLTVGTIKQGMDPGSRRAAYNCDITYCTNKELTFDYLKDRIVLWDRPGQVRLQLERFCDTGSRVRGLLLRGLHFAIVDEADSVLIDEARTPLIISAEASDFTEKAVYHEAFGVAKEMTLNDDFRILASDRNIEISDRGKSRIEEFPWQEARGWTTNHQREELVRQALVAQNLYVRDKQYIVTENKVQIVDEYTGRVMPDRSWERGLHQLIEIKEDCEMTTRKDTKARISYQRFFTRYMRLAGMTGTAREISRELWSTYHLRVVSIPTNRPLRRTFLPDRIFPTEQEKWKGVVTAAKEMSRIGRPVLIGTRSVSASERLSGLLQDAGLSHRVLNARQDKEEADIVAEAGGKGRITVATNMAGRGTDIRLDPGVADLGGLHVVATERHEARRIDRQLFGRCGRQGDPGSCEMLASLEDELVTLYAGNPVRQLATLLLKYGGSKATTRVGTALCGWAQRSAERLHARMRRNLLKMDEQQSDTLAFSGRME
jgi:preprotein translocase subunit SecA